MKWTGLNDLREQFLSFYETKDHLRMQSFPLVPQDDKGLLLINAGMAPLKKYFTGQAVPPKKRVTTCQKCIRTPDIERVGKTSRHGTYFEMLGNFSFGDYFKHEATAWAWEFLTKILEIPEDKLWVTIHTEDDQAFAIWTQEVGLPPERVIRMSDNFWEIGSGPCGPDSEIFFDRGEKYGCGSPDCAVGCDCDRYVEIWNLVFTQYNSDGKGNYTPLEHPNIDTGMGLERLACIMQGVGNLFEVDTVQNIMKHVSQIAGVSYQKEEKTDISLRVITDHIRSTTFMIGDGVVPQNEGRGYVLKRLLRRAARHGRLLGIEEPFLYKVCETVIAENASAYPELTEKKNYIAKIIRVEEERFAKTVDQGIESLNQKIAAMEAPDFQGEKILSGEEAFKLYDTYGFPIDLTREILEEHQMSVDEEEFSKRMEEQRKMARAARLALGDAGWTSDVLAELSLDKTIFTGYSTLEDQGEILAIVKDGEFADTITDGDSALLVLQKTPFYAESGGQVGDSGLLQCGESQFRVSDCRKSSNGLFVHSGQVISGVFSKGDSVTASVDAERRKSIMRNHSACHLLQAALRRVLGDHVHQAGSMVSEEVCRFDFSHFSAMTQEELQRTEALVNQYILDALDITVREMPIDQAKKEGAMALFGEKYGEIVRVCRMGDTSVEFCGGTHLDNTSKIGLFKITSESSVAAGIRRIEAVTGSGVLKLIDGLQELLQTAAAGLKLSNSSELPAKTVAIAADLKAKDKEISELNAKLAAFRADTLLDNAQEMGGILFLSASFSDIRPDALRAMGDYLKGKDDRVTAVLSSTCDGKGTLTVSCGAQAVKAGAHAGKLIKEIAKLAGGSGGGRPDNAMGSAPELSKLEEALEKASAILKGMLKSV